MVGSQAPYASKPGGVRGREHTQAAHYAANQYPNPYVYYPPQPYLPYSPAYYAPQPFPSPYGYPPYPQYGHNQHYYEQPQRTPQQYPNTYNKSKNGQYVHVPQIVNYPPPNPQATPPIQSNQQSPYQPYQPHSPSHTTQLSDHPSSPNQLPRIIFPGEIKIVDSIEKVKPALEELFRDGTAKVHGVGFDMEWQPNFGKGTPRNPTSLIQLSTDRVCVIFWMMYLGHHMPLELYDVLSSPDVLKIGQCLDSGDNERLGQEFHISLTNSVDVSIVAKQKGFRKTNLKEQTKVLLGKNLSKYLCTSNWADVHLTPAQIRYAATDPYVTFLIYHKLLTLPDAPVPPVAPPYDGEDEVASPPTAREDAVGVDLIGSMSGLAIADPHEAKNVSQDPEIVLSTPCPHCDRFFMKKVQLYAHLDCAHLELLPRGPQTCAACAKQFRKYSALKIHQDMTGHDTD